MNRLQDLTCRFCGVLVLFLGMFVWASFGFADPPTLGSSNPRVIFGEEEPPLTGFDILPRGSAVQLSSLTVGESTELEVTGSLSGTVWGTIVYTSDSSLPTAAVHAGLLEAGETGRVKVTKLPGRDDYEGSSRNGVTSLKYGPWQGSYWIEAAKSVQPSDDSIDLSQYRGEHGKVLELTLTGRIWGNVWGMGVYTDDSDLGTAAVHAGALKDGETGKVKVTIFPPQESYATSIRYGISSRPWGRWGGSFRMERAQAAIDQEIDVAIATNSIESPPELRTLRGQYGHVVTVTATGQTGGSVWGTEVYTDDSDIGTAAVHAGVLGVGETAKIRVTIVPGRSRYRGSEQNGIRSSGYSAWSGSFWIEPAAP